MARIKTNQAAAIFPSKTAAANIFRKCPFTAVFRHPPMDCPDACSPMHLVVRFNSSIAGAVTAIEGVIGEIPIFNTFCSPCSYAVPIARRAPFE